MENLFDLARQAAARVIRREKLSRRRPSGAASTAKIKHSLLTEATYLKIIKMPQASAEEFSQATEFLLRRYERFQAMSNKRAAIERLDLYAVSKEFQTVRVFTGNGDLIPIDPLIPYNVKVGRLRTLMLAERSLALQLLAEPDGNIEILNGYVHNKKLASFLYTQISSFR